MDLIKQNSGVNLGATSKLSASDITIGRISVQQSLSEFVKDEIFKSGDIVNMLTAEKLGDKKTSVEFLAVDSNKYWIEKEGDNFIGRTPALSANEKLWTEGNIKRDYIHSFYVLLPPEISKGMAIPLELPFKGKNRKQAEKFSSFLLRLGMNMIPSWGQVFNLSVILLKNDKNQSWYGFDVSAGRMATKEEMDTCEKWYTLLQSKQMNHQPDDEEIIVATPSFAVNTDAEKEMF